LSAQTGGKVTFKEKKKRERKLARARGLSRPIEKKSLS